MCWQSQRPCWTRIVVVPYLRRGELLRSRRKSVAIGLRTGLMDVKRHCIIITRAMLASAGISCCRVSVRPSVCPSVTSRCSTKPAKRRMTQRTLHDNPGNLFLVAENLGKTQTGSPPTEAPNAGAVAEIGDFQRKPLPT